ncbi:hypothetical protein C0992_006937 [Termitomyces sp. T32_za158]|nr:hypothetical protein C0992_006937 [Termitomyces sp. T32_za158]
MANAYAAALKPLKYLENLHLGVFLSDDLLLSSHISHVMEEDTPQPLLQDWSECRQCFDGIATDIRRRELEASIVIGQKLRTLKTIGWSSLVASNSGSARVEQYINSDDTIEDTGVQSQDELEEQDGEERVVCAVEAKIEEDRHMKTTIWIMRSKGRIMVRRAPW